MKKLHLLQCFDVTDAVKDGIEDFNRLSGNPCRIKKEAAKPVVQKFNKPYKILLVAVLATFVKLFK
jgi:hypothetical protein